MTRSSKKSPVGSVFELCPIEGSKGTFKILQYSLLYRGTPMSEKWLWRAFQNLTEFYPISLGHRVQLPDRNIIVVSQEDLDRQRFFWHSEELLSVDEFDKIKYSRHRWPPIMRDLLAERTADIECLLSAVAIRLYDGYLISLSVSHIIADAGSAVILLEQWAALATQVLDGTKVLRPPRAINYDHPGFWQRLTAHPVDQHPFVEYLEAQDYGNLDEVQAKVAMLFKAGSMDGGESLAMRTLCVSSQGIARLSKRFNTDKGARPLHGVQILYALLWQRYVASVLEARPEAAEGFDESIFLNLLHNTRGLVDMHDYVGNGLSTVYIPSTTGEILQMPVAELARKIKPYVNSITPGATVNLIQAMGDSSSLFALKAFYKYGVAASHMTISNASRMPFFEVDFGLGRPLAVLWGTRPTEGMSSWLPHGHDGGVDIYFGLKDDIYSALKNDPILKDFVDFAN